MSKTPSPLPGQRWRSLVDGHTVVTGDYVADDTFWIHYDSTFFATATDRDAFFDDYELVETVTQSVPAA